MADACQELIRADDPDVKYLFLDGALQRIDVGTPSVMADGGGRVGMEIDDIRSMYSGRINEGDSSDIPGGHSLTVANDNGGGIVFQTNGNGLVTAFHAAAAEAIDRAEGCHS